MNGRELDEIIKIYRNNEVEKKKLQKVRDRIQVLENDPVVMEYLNLIGILNEKTEAKLDKETYEDISDVVIATEESNKLLFSYDKVGVYADSDDASLIYVNIYRDLETECYYYGNQLGEVVTLPSRYKFKFKNNEEKACFEEKTEEFINLRKYFFEQLINKNQEDVVSELLKNEKKVNKLR